MNIGWWHRFSAPTAFAGLRHGSRLSLQAQRHAAHDPGPPGDALQPGQDADDAGEMAAADPPRYPGMTTGRRACGCPLDWAVRMRAPAAPVTWPALPLTLALIKPGAPAQALRARLPRTCKILQDREETLATADVRRLYPEANGAAFAGAVDAR
jgi:hypothetical protein